MEVRAASRIELPADFSRPRAQTGFARRRIQACRNRLATASGNFPVDSAATRRIAARTLLPADYIPTAVAAGDFNGDGIPDWVVSNGGSNNLWVYLGRGDGTFSQATVIPLTGSLPWLSQWQTYEELGSSTLLWPRRIAKALACSSATETDIRCWKNLLPSGSSYFHGYRRLNHDGHLDVLAGVFPDPNVPTRGPLVTLLGDGQGALVHRYLSLINFGVQAPRSIVVEDFEKNGIPDVVLVDPGVGAVVLLMTAPGLFKEAQPSISRTSGSWVRWHLYIRRCE